MSQAIGFLPWHCSWVIRSRAPPRYGADWRCTSDRDTWWSHSLAELRFRAGASDRVSGAAIAGLWGGGLLGAVVGCSLVSVVLAASVVGLSIPLLEAAVRLDPAVALRPIVISILAVMAPAIYAGFASLFLR